MAHLTLADAQLRLNQPLAAQEAAQQALALLTEPDPWLLGWALSTKASALMSLARLEEALALAEEAKVLLSRAPARQAPERRAHAMRVAARCLDRLGRDAEALTESEAAITAYGDLHLAARIRWFMEHSIGRTHHVRLLRLAKRYAEAIEKAYDGIETWSIFVTLKVKSAFVWRAFLGRELSQCLEATGKIAEAIEVVELAFADTQRASIGSDNLAVTTACYACLLARAGRTVEAATKLDEALALYDQLESAKPGQHRLAIASWLSKYTDDLWAAGERELSADLAIEYGARIRHYAAGDQSIVPVLRAWLQVQASHLFILERNSTAIAIGEELADMLREGGDEVRLAETLVRLSFLYRRERNLERQLNSGLEAIEVASRRQDIERMRDLLDDALFTAPDAASELHRHELAIELMTKRLAFYSGRPDCHAEMAESYRWRASDYEAIGDDEAADADAAAAERLEREGSPPEKGGEPRLAD